MSTNRKAKRRPEGFVAWNPEEPRVVSVFLEEVAAVFIPHDEIEGFSVAWDLDSPLGLDGSVQVWTPAGIQDARPGEWVVEVGVIAGRKTFVVMPDDVFRAEFAPLDRDATDLLGMYDERFTSEKGGDHAAE